MIFFTLEHILIHISFSTVSILIIIHVITLLVNKFIELDNSLEKAMITTFFCITGFLVTRWIYSGHLPLSDLYESLIFLSWGFSIIHMIPHFKKHKNFLSAIAAISTFFTQGLATSDFLTDIHQSKILVPALQSEWLMMHVSMMILGYATLLCGSLLSAALLVITFRKSIRIVDKNNQNLLKNLFYFGEIEYRIERSTVLKQTSSRNYYKFQLIQQLDHWGYRIISIGFLFLTLGILSGAVWANEAWGSYWNWDPKETWAFITWIIFSIYLHIRTNTNKKKEGFNSAIIASMGFLIIWICYFGVNLLGIGLHSYGSFPLTFN